MALKDWENCKLVMNGKPTIIELILNGTLISQALIDDGCQCYAAMSETIFKELNLSVITKTRREVRRASGAMTGISTNGIINDEVEISG